MKPDKLHIKIQEAASGHEPPFPEEAWSAMEKVLDEKMPVVKRGKRILFWWFLFIFIIAGGILWLLLPEKKNEPNQMSIIPQERQSGVSLTPALKADGVSITNSDSNEPRSSGALIFRINKTQKSISAKSGLKNSSDKSLPPNNSEIANTLATLEIVNEPDLQKNMYPYQTGVPQENLNSFPTDLFGLKKQLETGWKNRASINLNGIVNAKKKSAAQKKASKFSKRFSINFFLGAEVSAINLDHTGRVQSVYGAGISYKITNRLTARTGVHISRKIYDAPSSAYHPPAYFQTYYPYLKHVDANCKIFEIPLIMNYNFSRGADHQWFASAGIASYIMKSEDYEYFSKLPTGETSYDSYSIENKNQHFLSSLRIGAGYEKKLSPGISLSAEPYLYLPLSGIGYGKVKLYNSGILLTLSAQPFYKK